MSGNDGKIMENEYINSYVILDKIMENKEWQRQNPSNNVYMHNLYKTYKTLSYNI